MSAPTNVHHINFLVSDLHTSAAMLGKILAQTPHFESLPKRGVETARFDLSGIHLVLVSPTSDSGAVADILRNKGEGVFLLSLQVDDLDQSVAALARQGINMASTGPRAGLDNWQVWDINAGAALGPVLQLCQANS